MQICLSTSIKYNITLIKVLNSVVFSCVCVFSQSEASPVSSDSLISGFLLYGDNPKTWQQVWAVISGTEPVALYLYTAPQVGISVIDNVVDAAMWCTVLLSFWSK